MFKKYLIELSPEERTMLKQDVVLKKHVAARKRQHAQILLKADEGEGGPAWTNEQIAEAFDVSTRTVERVRRRCVEYGLEDALERRQDPRGPLKHRRLDGVGEARLCKIACSEPPEGREHWTLEMLRGELVRLKVVGSICRETVRQTLKKTKSSLG